MGALLQVLSTDAIATLDFGFVPASGHLVLATVCHLEHRPEQQRSQIAKLARSTFGFLAKSAGSKQVGQTACLSGAAGDAGHCSDSASYVGSFESTL